MSPQQHITTHSTPNSHRRQNTPGIRLVTPQTPHVMVRRSARQQYNLSQDMMVDAINQANHCFSISLHRTEQKSKISSPNNEVIIMPEMANAVIFPEIGKSLKHNELITKMK
jgi:hypothetical protein